MATFATRREDFGREHDGAAHLEHESHAVVRPLARAYRGDRALGRGHRETRLERRTGDIDDDAAGIFELERVEFDRSTQVEHDAGAGVVSGDADGADFRSRKDAG